MMHTEFNLVLKYCEALDEFVKIRVFSEEDAREVLREAAGADKSAFQGHVIRACLQDYNEGIEERIRAARGAGAAQDIPDVLYLLCVEVNPALEIHHVSIPLTCGPTDAAADPALRDQLRRRSRRNLARIIAMEKELRRRVIGQDRAVEIVTRAIKKATVGLRDPRRPIGAFLFVGQVGVGKTELAKAISEYLYGSQSRLIRVDCSEYALPHEYAKLIGSPPGYIGHNEGGYLTEAAKQMDEFIVLFDEIEKAHSKMHNILLQLLDEGMVTDSKGFKVSFRNALILMTSNLGVREVEALRGGIGFDYDRRQESSFEQMSDEIHRALRKTFRPEFLNRLDEILVFNTLSVRDSIRIVDLMLSELRGIAARTGIELVFQPPLKRYLAEEGWKREFGARELRRTIKRLIEAPLTDMILSGSATEGSVIRIGVRDRQVVLDEVGEADLSGDSTPDELEPATADEAARR